MPYTQSETRRDFLVLFAKTALFVPPAMATLGVGRLSGLVQGSGSNSGNGGGKGTDGNAGNGVGNSIGSLSSSGQQVQTTGFRTQGQKSDQKAPWNPGTAPTAPWSRPPPSSNGR